MFARVTTLPELTRNASCVRSSEKMNRVLCLNSNVLFDVNNISLEITKYHLNDGRFPLYLKTFFSVDCSNIGFL